MAEKESIKEFKIRMPSGWGFYNNFKYMHIRPAKNDRKKMVCVGRENFNCREFFARQMRSKFAGEGGYWGDGQEIDASKIYVGVAFERFQTIHHIKSGLTRLKLRMDKSLAILNALETAHGWPRTKAFPLIPEGDINIVPGYLFVGDKRWHLSPYLVSLYTLIIRLGHWDWVPRKVIGKDWPTVKGILKASIGSSKDLDREFVRQSLDSWEILVKHYKHLFGYKDRAYQWSSDRLRYSAYSTSEGIHKLVTGDTYHARLLAKFRKLRRGIYENENGGNKKDKP